MDKFIYSDNLIVIRLSDFGNEIDFNNEVELGIEKFGIEPTFSNGSAIWKLRTEHVITVYPPDTDRCGLRYDFINRAGSLRAEVRRILELYKFDCKLKVDENTLFPDQFNNDLESVALGELEETKFSAKWGW